MPSRQIAELLASGAPKRVLSARAVAMEKLHDDIAKCVRWPALQASLRADIDALRAASHEPQPLQEHIEALIYESIARQGSTQAAWPAVKALVGPAEWRRAIDTHTQRLRRRGLVRYEAKRWVVADGC